MTPAEPDDTAFAEAVAAARELLDATRAALAARVIRPATAVGTRDCG